MTVPCKKWVIVWLNKGGGKTEKSLGVCIWSVKTKHHFPMLNLDSGDRKQTWRPEGSDATNQECTLVPNHSDSILKSILS